MKSLFRNTYVVQISILICTINCAFAQNEDSKEEGFNRNAIYGNIGIGGLYFTSTAYYERILKRNKTSKNISHFVKVGIGSEAHWGEGGQYILAQYGVMTGVKKHHLEIGAGPNYFISGDFKTGFPALSGFVGWRIQKPGGNVIFRMGGGWPEAIYIGLGFSL